tara:strand:- start:71436 stop:73295 length:1860 start_codon:yes stop_codon:yes gene_type:complete
MPQNKLLASAYIQKALKAFSAEFKKNAQEKESSSRKKLDLARKDWLFHSSDQMVSKSVQAFKLGEIDASAGGGGFLPPEYVKKKLDNISELHLVDYSSHLATDKLTTKLANYCSEEKILPPHTKLYSKAHEEANSDKLFALAGYGTHHLFNLSMPHIIKNPKDVVIVTEPTYGLLLDPIFEAGGNVVSLSLNKKNKFKPTAKEMSALIVKTNTRLEKEYFAQIESNLNVFNTLHPMKKFKINKEIKKIKKAIKKSEKDLALILNDINKKIKHSALYKQNKKIAQSLLVCSCPKVRGFFNINPQTPLGTVLEQKEINSIAKVLVKHNVYAIDDLTHRSVLLNDIEPGTFAKSSAAKQTLTLISISKDFCLAGVRAGMAIGPKALISAMGKKLFQQQCMISAYSKKALSAVFGMPKEGRQKYIAENNDIYKFRKALVIALMDGIDAVKSTEVKSQIISKVNACSMKADLKKSALEGIADLDFVVSPDGAYFCLFDFSKYCGQYLGEKQMNTSMDFRNAFRFFADLETLPGELNFQFNKPHIRFCLTMSNKEIIEGMLRIKNVLSMVTEQPFVPKQKVKSKVKKKESPKPILHRFRPREESGYTKNHKLGGIKSDFKTKVRL